MAELPFVEKYRPVSLADICGDSNIKALMAFVRSGNFPLAIIFHGRFGTGKTTAAKAMVRDYYVQHGLYLSDATFRDIRSGAKIAAGYEGLFPPVLYVDAAVTRDIAMIRGLVQSFMKTVAPKRLVKFVIIDEGDRLGYDAQGALRSLIEKYPNTRTVYTANELQKIDPAIRDRAAGGIFEFKYPDVEEVATYLKGLSIKEGLILADEAYATMAETSESVREAVGKLGTEIAIAKAEEMPAAVPVLPEKISAAAPEPRVRIPPKDLSGYSTQELVKAIRAGRGHPNEAGYPFRRSETLHEFSRRGKKVLEDLGWPTQLDEMYRNRHTGGLEPLSQILGREGMWNVFRGAMSDAEKKLSKLTDGTFPERGALITRGLSTYKVSEAKKAVKPYLADARVVPALREAVRLHKGFDEYYKSGRIGEPKLLTDPFFRGDAGTQNILKMCRWLEIDVSRVEPIETLPLRREDIWRQVWSVIEHWEPEKVKAYEEKPSIAEVAAEALEDLGKIGQEALEELERM